MVNVSIGNSEKYMLDMVNVIYKEVIILALFERKVIKFEVGFFLLYKSILIESDGYLEWHESVKKRDDIGLLGPDTLKEIIKEAGIVGMGGAAFPAHVKLTPPADKQIDTVILNGAECEPYLTCDHRVMLEETEKVLKGFFGDIGESFFKYIQLAKMSANKQSIAKEKDSRVVINDKMLKFHENERRVLYRQKFEERLNQVLEKI